MALKSGFRSQKSEVRSQNKAELPSSLFFPLPNYNAGEGRGYY